MLCHDMISAKLVAVQVLDAGILPCAYRLLIDLVGRCKSSRVAFLEEIDCISTTLGLLINIAEGSNGALELPESPSSRSFTSLLCSLVEVV